jgi:hypothetical protein
MNQQDRLHLLAEQTFLRAQLAELPSSAKLTRMSDEARLKVIQTQLDQHPVDEAEPARTRLTFSGRPVIGSHGIIAEFGMKAVNSFTDAIATVAASIFAPLAQSGPIPNRENYQLLITNTALGSFGFELEEYRGVQSSLEEISPVALALEQTQTILLATQGSDEDLADSVSETDPRALEKIRSFLQVLADNEAICTLQYQNRSMRFTDVGQIKSSLVRLSQDNLQEKEETLQGEFQGILPKARTFEFKSSGLSCEIVKGKISKSIQDVDSLNRHLNQAVAIKVMATRVANGKPRYLLLELPVWEDTLEH